MEIFNVLFKGVEIKSLTWCKAFSTEDKAREFITSHSDKNKLRVCSTLGWNEDYSLDDYRVEDKEGNMYYYVLYRQLI